MHTRHGACGTVVQAVDARTEHGGAADGRILHTVHAGVDAEPGRAGDFFRNVQPRHAVAHQGERLRALQRRCRRGLERTGGRREFTIRRTAPGGGVHHEAVPAGQFGARHLPVPGRRGEQQFPGGGAGNAHAVYARGPYAHAAAGDLQMHHVADLQHGAVHGGYQHPGNLQTADQKALGQGVVGVAVFGRRLQDPHVVPARVQFVGQHLRQGRLRTLTHLRVGHDGGNRIVAAEFHPGIQQVFILPGYQGGQLRRRVAAAYDNSDEQGAAGCGSGGDEGPPAPLAPARPFLRGGRLIHGCRPQHGEWPGGYAGRSRSGTGCRAWPGQWPRRPASDCPATGQRRS